MALIRCTAKLRSRLNPFVDFTDEPPASAGVFEEWFCDLLFIDRRQCLLFTDAATLYAVLVVGVRRSEFQQFGPVFRECLRNSLAFDGFSAREADRLAPSYPDHFAKTNNRSVLGSMNDYVFHARFHIARNGGLDASDPRQIGHYLNDMPMSAIKSDPIRKVRSVLREQTDA